MQWAGMAPVVNLLDAWIGNVHQEGRAVTREDLQLLANFGKKFDGGMKADLKHEVRSVHAKFRQLKDECVAVVGEDPTDVLMVGSMDPLKMRQNHEPEDRRAAERIFRGIGDIVENIERMVAVRSSGRWKLRRPQVHIVTTTRRSPHAARRTQDVAHSSLALAARDHRRRKPLRSRITSLGTTGRTLW